jgi:hypothetical protein
VRDRGDFVAVIVRTDHSDEPGWRAVCEVLECCAVPEAAGHRPWEYEVVDDPDWAGASVDDVVAATEGGDYLSVIFVADRRTIRDSDHPFVAVATPGELDADDWPPETTFRIVPDQIQQFQTDVDVGYRDFADYATSAKTQGVFRGFTPRDPWTGTSGPR